jgi:subtilase family serine protease
MSVRRNLPLIVNATAESLVSIAPAIAAERIHTPVVNSIRVFVRDSIDPRTRRRYDLGPVSPSMIARATMIFSRSAQQETDFATLLSDLQKPLSRPHLRYFSSKALAARFGLAAKDIDKVVTWMKSQGLGSIRVSACLTAITFSGQVGIIETAFGTRIRRFRVGQREYLVNIDDFSIPAAFAGVISLIGGFGTPKLRTEALSARHVPPGTGKERLNITSAARMVGRHHSPEHSKRSA